MTGSAEAKRKIFRKSWPYYFGTLQCFSTGSSCHKSKTKLDIQYNKLGIRVAKQLKDTLKLYYVVVIIALSSTKQGLIFLKYFKFYPRYLGKRSL